MFSCVGVVFDPVTLKSSINAILGLFGLKADRPFSINLILIVEFLTEFGSLKIAESMVLELVLSKVCQTDPLCDGDHFKISFSKLLWLK